MVLPNRKSAKKRKKISFENKANNDNFPIENNGKVNGNKNNENATDDEDESWHIMEFYTLDKLQDEHVTICDNDKCNLRAWLVYEGVNSGNNWRTCTDCMLNDCREWPSL